MKFTLLVALAAAAIISVHAQEVDEDVPDSSPTPTAIVTIFAGVDGGGDNSTMIGAGAPNPAASCQDITNVTSETLYEQDGGEYGICVFADGTACDEWALYNGECEPGSTPVFSTYCADSGGELTNENIDWGEVEGGDPSAEYGVCTFEDGSECDEFSYYVNGCTSGAPTPTESGDNSTMVVGDGMVGMPNPASVNCEEEGGTSEIRYQADGGEYGLCVFEDGTACDEWALSRDECVAGEFPIFSTFCQENNDDAAANNVEGMLTSENVDWGDVEGGPPATYEVCTFETDGSVCAEYDYYGGGCTVATSSPVTNTTTPPDDAGLWGENDASGVHCTGTGGTYESHYEASGLKYVICVFGDFTACDAWAYYDGSCDKGSTPQFWNYCLDSNGEIEIRSVEGEEPSKEYAVCVYGDGSSECSEYSYYEDGTGECEEAAAAQGVDSGASAFESTARLALCIHVAGLLLLP